MTIFKLTKRVSASAAFFLLTASILFVLAGDAAAERRHFMTDAEIELVRENQDINLRIDVLTKMIDRRFAALNVEVGGWKAPAKESDKWGDAPTGTRHELLTDIKRLLQKAVDDIDDVAEHDAIGLEQNKKSGLLFPKAVRNLGTASARYSTALKTMLNTVTDELERGAMLDSVDLCGQIIDAAARIPPEVKKSKT